MTTLQITEVINHLNVLTTKPQSAHAQDAMKLLREWRTEAGLNKSSDTQMLINIVVDYFGKNYPV